MVKKIILFVLLCILAGGAFGLYAWYKPHESIGTPKYNVSAKELASEFNSHETEAIKKYVGSDKDMVVVQVSGVISSIQKDTSGISLSLDTGDPLLGVSCTLDKFTKQPRSDFKTGEQVLLKGICTGKLSDVIMDRCVIEK